VEEQRLKTLHQLLSEAATLQEQANKLVAEITDQLQRSIFIHDDMGVAIFRPKADRRRTSRE
jgi:hypothetical protein